MLTPPAGNRFSSLRNWRDSFARGTVLAAEPSREARKPRGKITPATFLMSFECHPVLSPCLKQFDYPIMKSCVIRNRPANERGQA